jgi:hypothetical protein
MQHATHWVLAADIKLTAVGSMQPFTWVMHEPSSTSATGM